MASNERVGRWLSHTRHKLGNAKASQTSALETMDTELSSINPLLEITMEPNPNCLVHDGNPLSGLEAIIPGTSTKYPEQQKVRLLVGTGLNRRLWIVHLSLLLTHVEYFRLAYGQSCTFFESLSHEFKLEEDDPEDIELFLYWLYLCPTCKQYKEYDKDHVCISTGPKAIWCRPGIEGAWAVGDRFLCQGYMRFCLGFFVQHLHNLDPDRARWIFQNTTNVSPLQRVTRTYINIQIDTGNTSLEKTQKTKLWYERCRIAQRQKPGDLEQGRSRQLIDVGHEFSINNSETFHFGNGSSTLMYHPKRFEIMHWESDCATNPSSACNHQRPTLREATQSTIAVKEAQQNSIMRVQPRASKKFKKLGWNGITAKYGTRLLWSLYPTTILALSLALLQLDQKTQLASTAGKRFSVGVGILGVIGIRYRWVAWIAVVLSIACGGLVIDHARRNNTSMRSHNSVEGEVSGIMLWQMEFALGDRKSVV